MADGFEHIPKHMIFDGNNFDNWLYRMGILLDGKGYNEFMKTKLADLVAAETDAAKKLTIKNDEKKCKSLIVRYIHDSQLEYIKAHETVYEIIDALKKVFQRKSVAGQLILRRRLLTMKFDGEDIADHFLAFDKAVRELKSIGATLEEIDVVCHLLLTLPESYDGLVTALETLDPEKLTLDFVKSRLMDEHGKRLMNADDNNGSTNSAAMHAGTVKAKKCWRCGSKGHVRSRCYVNLKKNSQNGQGEANCSLDVPETLCAFEEIEATTLFGESFCDESSHGNDTVCMNVKAKHVANACDGRVKFILDSGSTHHLVNNKQFFSKLVRLEKSIKISVAKGDESMIAKAHGEIKIKIQHNGESSRKTIKDVLFIESLRRNLLSIRQLVEKGYEVEFGENCARISFAGNVQFIAKRKGNLYEVEFQLEQNNFAGMANENDLGSSENIWHFRLGHENAANMKTTRELVDGLERVDVDAVIGRCESCVKGKKSDFPINKIDARRSNRILELVHTAICGPMSERALDGARYFISFTDDYSRATQIFCMKRKGDALERFKDYVKIAEARHGVKIGKLKAVDDGEYSSKDFQLFCKAKGINLSCAASHNLGMSSVAREVNRMIVQKARALLSTGGLPLKFWSEAVLSANFIGNRCISGEFVKRFGDKSPAEIWYGQKPNLSNFRIFGSVCYNRVMNQKVKCIMLGYNSSTLYRLWDIENNKLVVGRKVTFNEKSIFDRLNGKVSHSEAVYVPIDELDEIDGENTSLNHSTEERGTGDNKSESDKTDGACCSKDLDHSAELLCTGDFKDTVHSTDSDGAGHNEDKNTVMINNAKSDCIGDCKDTYHSAEEDCTGVNENIEGIESDTSTKRRPRKRRQTKFFGVNDEDETGATSSTEAKKAEHKQASSSVRNSSTKASIELKQQPRLNDKNNEKSFSDDDVSLYKHSTFGSKKTTADK